MHRLEWVSTNYLKRLVQDPSPKFTPDELRQMATTAQKAEQKECLFNQMLLMQQAEYELCWYMMHQAAESGKQKAKCHQLTFNDIDHLQKQGFQVEDKHSKWGGRYTDVSWT
jgi:hypothetical protein